jgi:predicted glycosyltransferase
VKIWFDADNGPHVLIMRPLVAELAARGHELFITARDRTSTCELLDLFGLEHLRVGGEYRPGMAGKIAGTLGRALALARAARGRDCDVSFGHGSRALPPASRLLGIPSVTMYDYEWVDPRLFNWCCRSILLPEAVSLDRCGDAGIDRRKVNRFPGYKEELYLGGRDLDPTVSGVLGLRPDRIGVLLRPPATTAHYHNSEAEDILAAILAVLAAESAVQLVYLPRTPDQRELPARAGIAEVIVPDQVFDGPSLVAAMDLVLSGGGTMTREAAIMGVPSYSFFRGRGGMVDGSLADAGRLTLLPDAETVADRLRVRRREAEVVLPDPARLVAYIADRIEEAAR